MDRLFLYNAIIGYILIINACVYYYYYYYD